MNVYPLRDIKTIPDIVQEYPQDVKSNHLPLVIDNGELLRFTGFFNLYLFLSINNY